MSGLILQSGEKVIHQARRHWLIFLTEAIGLALALIVPLVALGSLEVDERTTTLISFCFAAWTLIIFLIFCVLFTNYYLDLFIVTNRRLIDVEQLGLFARDVAIAPLENIEDIKIEVVGIIPTFFKYGTLHVQTAATNREITVRGITKPYKVKEAILSVKDDISIRSRRTY